MSLRSVIGAEAVGQISALRKSHEHDCQHVVVTVFHGDRIVCDVCCI